MSSYHFDGRPTFYEKVEPKEDKEAINCENCGRQWFQQIPVGRYKKTHRVVLTQRVPLCTEEYYILQCISCGNKQIPLVLQGGVKSKLSQDWDNLQDTLEERKVKKVEI